MHAGREPVGTKRGALHVHAQLGRVATARSAHFYARAIGGAIELPAQSRALRRDAFSGQRENLPDHRHGAQLELAPHPRLSSAVSPTTIL